jgi:hypothetical protein
MVAPRLTIGLDIFDLLQCLIKALLRIAPLYPVNATALPIMPYEARVR